MSDFYTFLGLYFNVCLCASRTQSRLGTTEINIARSLNVYVIHYCHVHCLCTHKKQSERLAEFKTFLNYSHEAIRKIPRNYNFTKITYKTRNNQKDAQKSTPLNYHKVEKYKMLLYRISPFKNVWGKNYHTEIINFLPKPI